MWAFKASFTVLLQTKCSWFEFSLPLVVLSVWTFLAEGIITKFTHPFNPIRSGEGGGGGLRCLDDQTHICHSETSYPMMPKCYDFQCLSLRHILTKF